MKKLEEKFKSGQSLIEVLIAVAILSFVIVIFLFSFSNLAFSYVNHQYQIEATQYAREGLEMVYNISVNSENWEDFVDLADPDKTYSPFIAPEGLVLIEGVETIEEKFTREIFLEKALRDPVTGEITGDSGEEDENTLKATARVSWQFQAEDQYITYITYLINWQ